jgi:MmgE/PrpD N-terminal domain
MHNPVAHSAVADALVTFATAPLTGTADRALAAARHALDNAGKVHANNVETARKVKELLQSQGGSGGDARVRAWVVGAQLARESTPGIAMPVLAAVLAMSDHGAVSNDDAAATAIGIEVATRILAAVDSDEYRQRWNVASSVGVLGAVLAVSRLLKLDANRTRHALGIAATQAAGLAHYAGQAMESIEIGKAAADAIEVTLMAKHGFTSAPAAVDGRRGFAALMAYRFDADAIIEGLGSRWITAS